MNLLAHKWFVAVVAGTLIACAMAVSLVASPAKGADRVSQGLTQKDARFYIQRDLKSRVGKKWLQGTNKRIYDCKNISKVRVRCQISWIYNDNLLIEGDGTAFYKPGDHVHVFTILDLKAEHL